MPVGRQGLLKELEDFMRCENVLLSIQSYLEVFQANSLTIFRALYTTHTPKCSFFQISLDVNQSLSFFSPPTINSRSVALKTYLKRELRATLDNQHATIKYQCNVYPLWIIYYIKKKKKGSYFILSVLALIRHQLSLDPQPPHMQHNNFISFIEILSWRSCSISLSETYMLGVFVHGKTWYFFPFSFKELFKTKIHSTTSPTISG